MLLSVCLFLCTSPCQGGGFGSNLLSLLTGQAAKIDSDPGKTQELVNRISDIMDIQTSDRQAKKTEIVNNEDSTLIDTINLSYTGNTDFSNTISKARQIGSSLASAIGSVVDLKFVRSVVDIAVDRLHNGERQGRSDSDNKSKEQEKLKAGITTVVGAALGEQECWERTACKVGEYTSILPGKDVLFILLDRVAPTSWFDSLNLIKDSATYEQDCNLFECSADPEGTENDV